MTKVVQFTMSRIPNYGSVLQTYALQRAIEKIPGCICQTIDYLPQSGKSQKRCLKNAIRSIVRGLVYGRSSRGFDHLKKKDIHLTRPYVDFNDLKEDPPEANVYVTGSDQMFNPIYTNGDPAYFFEFLSPDRRAQVRKISYASSFAQELPAHWRDVYAKALMDYDALSLREQYGVDLAQELTGKLATLCCDPTLLLTRQEWMEFAAKAKRRIRHPYILCYNLAYRVNPYPMANEVERAIQEKLKLPILFVNGSKADLLKANSKVIKWATPYEFVDLFFNASFIMTSSFHGTAFALQSGKPFLSYVSANAAADNRISDLLVRCGAQGHIVPIIDGPADEVDLSRFDFDSVTIDASLCRIRAKSTDWLEKNILNS